MSSRNESLSRHASAILWTIQAILAALFLFAGAVKLSMPAALLAQQAHMPAAFLRFIAVCEILGALGLLLPGIFRVHRELTPLAAAGLVLIMIGAVTVTVLTMGVAPALVPFLVGVLALSVAYGRGRRYLPGRSVLEARTA